MINSTLDPTLFACPPWCTDRGDTLEEHPPEHTYQVGCWADKHFVTIGSHVETADLGRAVIEVTDGDDVMVELQPDEARMLAAALTRAADVLQFLETPR